MKPRPASSPAATRDALLRATGEVFAEAGYRAATVRAICQRAGANIAAVVAAANRVRRSPPFVPGDLAFRVYLRHAADFPAIRATLAELLGAAADIVYVQADICRADLLLEIEAYASHNLGNCR